MGIVAVVEFGPERAAVDGRPRVHCKTYRSGSRQRAKEENTKHHKFHQRFTIGLHSGILSGHRASPSGCVSRVRQFRHRLLE